MTRDQMETKLRTVIIWLTKLSEHSASVGFRKQSADARDCADILKHVSDTLVYAQKTTPPSPATSSLEIIAAASKVLRASIPDDSLLYGVAANLDTEVANLRKKLGE
jgi:hypothetical protein